MLLSTAEDLARFVSELRQESDRGLPLVAAALIDDLLKETLRAFFCIDAPAASLLDRAESPLGTLSSRIQACFALGLIDEFEFVEIGIMRKVRNEFAHAKHGTTFATPRIADLCARLKSDLPQDADYPLSDPRFRLMNAAVVLVLRLYHRPDWVALERRKPKQWVSAEATKWRSFQTDPPPPGISPVMAIGHGRPHKAE
jgi:mannitol operon repressor